MQALTLAAQQLQAVADQFQGVVSVDPASAAAPGPDNTATSDAAAATTVAPGATGSGGETQTAQDMQQMQTQATQALDQFDQALAQVGEQGVQQIQPQVASLQQQSQQVRQQVTSNDGNAGQGLQELAQSALQLQTASIPAEADAIVGRQIVTSDGEEGGEVADVLITADGQVEALLIKRGGALGLGGTQVAVPWDEVQLQGDQIVVNATRDQLRDMPEYQTE
jgi:sporulation protein YlmC with PRC-barrel domain